MDVSVVRGGGTILQLALNADGQPFALLSTATAAQLQIVYQDDNHKYVVLVKNLANMYMDNPTLGVISIPILPSDTQVIRNGSYQMVIQVTTPITTFVWMCSDLFHVLEPLSGVTPPIPTATQLAVAFTTLDVDVDTYLSFTEFKQLPYVRPPVLYIPGHPLPDKYPTESQLQILFTLLDTDKDSQLSLTEFQQLPFIKPPIPAQTFPVGEWWWMGGGGES